jgi:hypothetical protein
MNKPIRKSVIKIMFVALVQTMKLSLELIRRTKAQHLVRRRSSDASVSEPKSRTRRRSILTRSTLYFFGKDAVKKA